jgi:ribosome modulation factor
VSWGHRRSINDTPLTIWRNRGYDDGRAGLSRMPPETPAEHRSAYMEGFRRGSEQRAEQARQKR